VELKQTPLYEKHLEAGGKMVDFGGWELPVQFQGIFKEHEMVRTRAGLFDVSHMGEIEVKGEKAQSFIQYLMTNDIEKARAKQVQYTLMCNENGGILDDLLVYKYSTEHYLLVVNAANTDKDYAWIKKHAPDDLQVEDVSSHYAQLALQGPRAQDILQQLCSIDLQEIKFFYFHPEVKINGYPCMVSRTGYTGEDGFEIYLSPQDAPRVWDAILKAGGEDVCPVGLGARDTLRLEAKLPLYGQEMNEDITPYEAGLGFFVKLDSHDFIGRQALQKQKKEGPERKQVEFVMIGKGIPRSTYEIEKNGKTIGYVTSGLHAPTLKQNIGLALIDQQYANPGETFDVLIRNKAVKAQVAKDIFYKKKTRK